MKLLFLRGQVPQDRDPSQIMFDNLNDCDDMWTQLASALVKDDDYGELWYWGGSRKVVYRDNFVERWLPSFKDINPEFKPDVIFARGGFPHYDSLLRRYCKQSFLIYYGAGERTTPKKGMFDKFDLIINDNPKQLALTKKRFPNIKARLWTKPAAENIFYPYQNQDKEFDIIMVGNEDPKGRKGHDLVLGELQNDFKILQVGITSKTLRKKYPNVEYKGWIPRKDLPSQYAKAKCAVVACTERDSCPRVVPEAIACGCPLLVSSRVNIWHEKYIDSSASMLFDESELRASVINTIKNLHLFKPNQYYKENLSMKQAVCQINEYIK